MPHSSLIGFSRSTGEPGSMTCRVSSLHQAVRAKGLALRIGERVAAPMWLLGDGLRLEQVLFNLAGNAIKFTEHGEGVIRVQPREADETNIRLRFEVRDTGIAIAPEGLAGLFDPFIQAEAYINRRFGGTGLGLSISKRLVELMGSEIGAESRIGEGSTCWFELPLARAAAGEPVSRPRPTPERPAGPRLTGMRVLVVDDSALNRDVVERALGLEGAIATLAADGQQAVQLLRARPAAFDAVLMDVQMPVMDGLTATRLIRGELGLTEVDARLASLEGQLAALSAASAPWLNTGDAAATSPLAEAPPLDTALLEALRTALTRRNLRARTYFAQLQPALQGVIGIGVTAAISQAIQLWIMRRPHPAQDSGRSSRHQRLGRAGALSRAAAQIAGMTELGDQLRAQESQEDALGGARADLVGRRMIDRIMLADNLTRLCVQGDDEEAPRVIADGLAMATRGKACANPRIGDDIGHQTLDPEIDGDQAPRDGHTEQPGHRLDEVPARQGADRHARVGIADAVIARQRRPVGKVSMALQPPPHRSRGDQVTRRV